MPAHTHTKHTPAQTHTHTHTHTPARHSREKLIKKNGNDDVDQHQRRHEHVRHEKNDWHWLRHAIFVKQLARDIRRPSIPCAHLRTKCVFHFTSATHCTHETDLTCHHDPSTNIGKNREFFPGWPQRTDAQWRGRGRHLKHREHSARELSKHDRVRLPE